jgi:hypothetical protein
MEGEGRRGRFRSFVLGSLLGASAAVATARRRREVGRRRQERLRTPAGLAAFEGAPCYRELTAAESDGHAAGDGRPV